MNISFSKLKKEINNIIFALKIIGNPIKKKKKIKDEPKKNTMKKLFEKKSIKNKNDKIDKKLYLRKKIKLKTENNKQHITQINSNITFKNINFKNNIIFGKNKTNINDIIGKKGFELNSLEYEEAFQLDHRNFCQYYISLIKYNHPISFSFGSYNDYNSKTIKIFLFFFSFYLEFVINALFFTDDTMHKIYEDKGKFNFLYQIPQILYSTLISRVIDSFIKNFALSQDIISSLKQEKEKKGLEKIRKKLISTLKYKFTIFFLSTFIVLLFLLYYITCFWEYM